MLKFVIGTLLAGLILAGFMYYRVKQMAPVNQMAPASEMAPVGVANEQLDASAEEEQQPLGRQRSSLPADAVTKEVEDAISGSPERSDTAVEANPQANADPLKSLTPDDWKLDSMAAIRVAITRFEVASTRGDFKTAQRFISAVAKAKPTVIRYQLYLGDNSFFVGDFNTCIAAYDQAIKLDASLEPQLWQRGLAQFYAGRFEEGVKQFETHQTVNSQDVENAVWHVLCQAKVSSLEAAREKMIAIDSDARVPMREVFEMFAGRMKPKDVMAAAESTTWVADTRLQRYYGHLYVGLYQELIGETAASMKSMQAAVDVCPFPRGNFMGEVARVHLASRKK